MKLLILLCPFLYLSISTSLIAEEIIDFGDINKQSEVAVPLFNLLEFSRQNSEVALNMIIKEEVYNMQEAISKDQPLEYDNSVTQFEKELLNENVKYKKTSLKNDLENELLK